MIEKLDLQENFLLLNENLSFVRLIEQADIVLRPTNTDGDALTVREALYLGKPIIASDIVNRPLGTILFKSRDIDALEIILKETIERGWEGSSFLVKEEESIYKDFYKELINNTYNKK